MALLKAIAAVIEADVFDFLFIKACLTVCVSAFIGIAESA